MNNKIKILTVLGTRPEAIKLTPFLKAIELDTEFIGKLCTSTQHKELQNDVLNFFKLNVDYNLDIMREKQDLFHITECCLSRLNPILKKESPDFVVIQGDTTTAFGAGLAAFYHKIPIVHLEAGLRTGNPHSPYPEEMNRSLLSRMATFHMAPTERAVMNLKSENITHNVYLTGNTIIDAIRMILDSKDFSSNPYISTDLNHILNNSNDIVLITVHRRENFGEPLKEICLAIQKLSKLYPNMQFVWPVHPNPNIKDYVIATLSEVNNIKLLEPVSYECLIQLMSRSKLILSDSGGIQEESCILNRPILILRDKTERPEVLESGLGELVGSSYEKILSCSKEILDEKNAVVQSMKKNIYGEPGVSMRILNILKSGTVKK